MKKSIIANTLAIIGILLSNHTTVAGSITASTKTTATIAKTCSLSATNISFGNLNLSNVQTLANGTISILCSNKTSYTVALTYGTPATKGYYTNGQPDTGLMTGATSGDIIAYGIQPATINNNNPAWGRSTPVTGTGTGSMQTMTMYGEAQLYQSGPSGVYTSRYPTPDNYADTVTLTLTY